MTLALKILLVDDHVVVREGFRRLLAETFAGAGFGEAGNAAEALAAVAADEWSIVLLDLSLPGRGGLELLKELKATRAQLPVVVVTMHAEEQYAVRAFRAGASGYLMKDAPPEALFDAVRRVAAGGRYVSAALGEKLAASLSHEGSAPGHAELSDREFEVLKLLARGMTVSQIGRELKLSEKTISTYRTRMLEKLSLSTTADLISYAIRAGIGD